MATVYNVEITSHWVNYTPKQLKEKIEKVLAEEERNEYSVEVRNKF